ncbi:hypothetical protein NMG60_11018295 [Bertholletia excelsa]
MKKVIDELIKGRGCAAQLQSILQRAAAGDHGSVSPDKLVDKILISFTKSLSALSSWEGASGGCHQLPAATTQVGSPCGDRKSVESGKSSRMPLERDRRGVNKKRKVLKTWIMEATTKEDGHAWRKYGQKKILNAKYPRCYYRCTHKHDRHCLAKKQVQRIQEEPSIYQIKYQGNHTCEDTAKSDPSQFNLPAVVSNGIPVSQEQLDPSSSVKEERKEEEQSEPASECNMWQDLAPLDSPGVDVLKAPELGDAISAVHSTASTGSHGLEVDDFFVESGDFANAFL